MNIKHLQRVLVKKVISKSKMKMFPLSYKIRREGEGEGGCGEINVYTVGETHTLIGIKTKISKR